VYGILQYLGWDPLLDAKSYSVAYNNLSIVRPPSSIGHAVYFANYLIGVIFVAVALAAGKRPVLWKAVAFTAALIAVVALVLSGTRAGLIGLALGAAFLAALRRVRLTPKRLIALGLLAAAVTGLSFTFAGARLRDRARQWSDDAKGGPRLLLWRDSLRMARAHLLLGGGPETFATEFPKPQSLALAQAYPNFYHESPHNICLDALLSQGLPGLVLLLLFFGLGISASFRWTADRLTATALASGLVGAFASQQFTGFVLSTALLCHLLVAILVAGSVAKSDERVNSGVSVRILQLLALPASALFLAIGADLMFVDWHWRSIENLLERGQAERAMAEYSLIQRIYPPESGPDVWYSRALTEAAKNSPNTEFARQARAEALEAAIRSTKVSEDRHNAFYNLALLYLAQGYPDNAESALWSTVEYAPRWFKPHGLLAEILISSHKLEAASTEAQKAIKFNGGKNPEVDNTLRRIRSLQQTALPRQLP
jgi:O-antigen ligase